MTNKTSTRVVAMVCEGIYQQDFVRRLGAAFNLVGIVIFRPNVPEGSFVQRFRRCLGRQSIPEFFQSRCAMWAEERAAQSLRTRLFDSVWRGDLSPTGIPQLVVDNINDTSVATFLLAHKPDVVCVNGTNLLRKDLLGVTRMFRYGFINLHTGLSPYARGGNCDLFMLLEGHPEFVGITIHHIDAGIDSGDIILTARPDLAPQDNYAMIEAKSFHLGNRMMVVAVSQLFEGRAVRVKQWQHGKEFLRRTGYVYDPVIRLRVNEILKNGLVAAYLADKLARDERVQLVGEQT